MKLKNTLIKFGISAFVLIFFELTLYALFGGYLHAQQQQNQMELVASGPSPVSQVSARTVGAIGQTTLYYWVVAKYPRGNSITFGPITAFQAPNTLTGGNYVQINWNAAAGATGYDVIKNTTPNYPGDGNVAVVLNTAALTVNDIGSALSAYVTSTVGQARGVERLDNALYAQPRFVFDQWVMVPELCFSDLTCQSTASGGGGASTTPIPVTVSGNIMTIGAGCTPSTPCNFGFGSDTISVTQSATATISAGTGTAYVYVTDSGVLSVGHNGLTIVCSAACSVVPAITGFPYDNGTLYTWTATTGVWDISGGSNKEALLNNKVVVAGSGLTPTQIAGKTVLSADFAVVAPYSAGTRGLSFTFDPGTAITVGRTDYLRIPFACTIVDWSILSDTAETVSMQVWKIATGTAKPTVANTISTSDFTLSSGTLIRSSTVTNFTTTAVTANDIMAVNITAITASTFVNVVIGCQN